MTKNALLSVFGLLALAACGSTPETTSPSAIESAERIAVGRMKPIQVAVYSRGTHILVNDRSVTLYYVESPTLDLNRYTGMQVRLTGAVEPLGSTDQLFVATKVDVVGEESSMPSSLPSDMSSIPSSVTSSVPSTVPRSSTVISSVPTVVPSSTPVSAPPVRTEQAADATSAGTAAWLESNLPTLLAGTSFTGTYRVTEIALAEQRYAYVTFTDGTTKGRILVKVAGSPVSSATVVGTFTEGETTDWVKEAGENPAKTYEATILSKAGSTWKEKATVAAGMALYTNATKKFSIQYPMHWYYAGAKEDGTTHTVTFSDKADPAATTQWVKILIVPSSLDFSGSYFVTEVARDAKTKFVFTADAASAATASKMAATLVVQ